MTSIKSYAVDTLMHATLTCMFMVHGVFPGMIVNGMRKATAALSLYYCDVYVVQLPRNHRFPMTKYAQTRKRVETLLQDSRDRYGRNQFKLIRRNGLKDINEGTAELSEDIRNHYSYAGGKDGQQQDFLDVVLTPSSFVSKEQAQLVHCGDYYDRFVKGSLTRSEEKALGFPWSRDLVRRTLASSLGTAQAAFDALETGFAGQIAGGTHHAFYDYGEGFCTFNDISIASALLLDKKPHHVRKILVIDLDVHQGNGTAKMFQNDDRVYTFSMHCKSNLFSKKQFGDRDVELPEGVG